MRPVPVACFALLLSCASGCGLLKRTSGDAGPDAAEAAPSAPASEGPAEAVPPPTVTATHAAARPTGPPAAGNPCTSKEGVNGLACAHGGFEELECVAGAWKILQTCRGPGGCKEEGTSLHCDVGTPVATDACMAGSTPRCTDTHSLLSCQNGKWVSSMCVPPSKCEPNAKNGAPGCK